MKSTAKIVTDYKKSGVLWLFVDREEGNNAAYAILPDEVEAIGRACHKYLKNYVKN